jgi:hypothetical protein
MAVSPNRLDAQPTAQHYPYDRIVVIHTQQHVLSGATGYHMHTSWNLQGSDALGILKTPVVWRLIMAHILPALKAASLQPSQAEDFLAMTVLLTLPPQ